MADLYKYHSDFVPILLEGMTARLFGSEIEAQGLNVVCKAIVALPERYKDFGAVTAATWDTDNEDTGLELNDLELGQFRMRIVDDMQCRLKNPSPVTLWRTTDANFYLPQFPTDASETFLKEFFWKASEFFVYEDTTPRFDFYSSVALTTARVLFSGWKIKVSRIAAQGKIDIYVNSWPSSS